VSGPATLPQCLLHNAAAMPRLPAFREKRHGIWQTTSWSGYADRVRRVAGGLAAHGFTRGDRLAVLGENRPCWYAAMLAAQALGGTAVPLHPESDVGRLQQIMRDARVAVAMVEDAAQAEKLVAAGGHLPDLEIVIVLAPRGLSAAPGGACSLAELEASGRVYVADHPEVVDAAIGGGRADALALLLYPWGRDTLPRPLALSHASLLSAAHRISTTEDVRPDDRALCYLPLASIEDVVYSQALGLGVGFVCHCPEGPDTVPVDLREVGPTFLVAPPRVLQILAEQLNARAAAASPLKRRLFTRFAALAEVAEKRREAGDRDPFAHRLAGLVGEVLIRAPVRDQLGLSHARWVHTGEGPLAPALARQFRALGVRLRPPVLATPAHV
jgi:long-chain acyl-CoA synthetase